MVTRERRLQLRLSRPLHLHLLRELLVVLVVLVALSRSPNHLLQVELLARVNGLVQLVPQRPLAHHAHRLRKGRGHHRSFAVLLNGAGRGRQTRPGLLRLVHLVDLFVPAATTVAVAAVQVRLEEHEQRNAQQQTNVERHVQDGMEHRVRRARGVGQL